MTLEGPLIGERFGPYRIVRRLGRGGMGEVYEARKVGEGVAVALKILLGTYDEKDEELRRFEREGKLLCELQHPGIVHALSPLTVERGRAYYAMEYVAGRDVREMIAEGGRLKVARAVRIAEEVLDALGFAHGRGVVHRDVTPGNILIDEAGRAHLVDFGLARIAGLPSVTKSGCALGTPTYMAPEQVGVRDVEPDGRTDLYALGIVLYEMLSGHPPFQAKQPFQLIRMHLEAPVPPLGVPGVPSALEAVIRRALAKRPEDRFATAADMLAALRGAGPFEDDEEDLPRPSAERRAAAASSRLRLLVLLVLVLVLVLVFWRLGRT